MYLSIVHIALILLIANNVCTGGKARQASGEYKKFELMLTRRSKAYSSSGSVDKLKIGMFTQS